MANKEHLRILKKGVDVWNKWRVKNPGIRPNLSSAKLEGADLRKINLSGADVRRAELYKVDLRGADLSGADFREANLVKGKLKNAILRKVNLSRANLSLANLVNADLSKAKLTGAILERVLGGEANLEKVDARRANLSEANFSGANFSKTKLRNVDLTKTNLSKAALIEAELGNAILVETNLESADLTGCRIHGLSAWNLKMNEKTKQSNLIITPEDEPSITVEDLEMAQFIYLLLNRQNLRNVIDTITSKAVLILGRFRPERKIVLDAMANELRKHNLLPIIFEFDRATSRDFTETIKTLAGLSLFVIADITNPKSASLELQATIPDYQIPFVPIIEKGEKPFSMFRDLPKYPWVLELLTYPSLAVLLEGFKKAIIDEAFEMHKKMLSSKARKMKTRSFEDYLGEGKVK